MSHTLIDAVIAAHKRGVKVRVMLNPARHGGESENEEARKLLTDAGISVHDSNPAFALTHQKSMVIDGKIGFVGSINLAPGSFDARRELAIETDDPVVVKRLEETAMHDWSKSHLLDLSDAALLADLKKHELSPDKLARNENSEHWGYHHNGHHKKHHGDKA